MNDCRSKLSRPFESAAYCATGRRQFVAAPMPRFGSVWDESVCRVPKAASVRIECSMFLALTSLSMCRTSLETGGPWWSPPPAAVLVPSAIGTDAARAPAHTTANRPYASLLLGPPPR
jgi:hypothetical protein